MNKYKPPVLHVPVWKKITGRLFGEQMRYLLQTLLLLLKYHDEYSLKRFNWATKAYVWGMSHMGLFDYLGIVSPKRDEHGDIAIGNFRFYYDSEVTANLLKLESDDILADYIIKRNLDEYRPSFAEGSYEIVEVSLRKNDIVIDAGANMGVFSLLAAAKKAKTSYAFEPMANIRDILDYNIKRNGFEKTIKIVPMGLSDITGPMTFSFSDDLIGSASVVFTNQGVSAQVQCTTLDDWVKENNIPRVDFIKADIEGAERNLLAGAKETLRKFKPRLAICTYHLPDDPQVLERLIKEAVPQYKVIQKRKKLFAYVPDLEK